MTKQSMTLDQAVDYLKRQDKRDIIVPLPKLSVWADAGEPPTLTDGTQHYRMRDRAHEQLGLLTDIPRAYYRRCMAAHPDVLALQINTWLRDLDAKDARMVRLIGNDVRAILSSRYRRVDSLFVLSRAIDGLKRTKLDFRIESMDVTDERMHLKAIFPTVLGEPKVGDISAAGVHVWTDEVGRGTFGVAPFIYTLACKNGATVNIAAHKGRHIGRNLDADDVQDLSQEAVDADDHALGLKIRDLTERYADEVYFQAKIVEPMRKAAGETMASTALEAEKAVRELGKAQLFAENEIDATLAEFLRAGDWTRYGLANAVTRIAQDVESYERSCELESVGGSLLVAN